MKIDNVKQPNYYTTRKRMTVVEFKRLLPKLSNSVISESENRLLDGNR